MRTFPLHLQDATHVETIDDVVSFVGEDRSGSFGIQAGHVRTIASLTFGLARYRTLAGPGGYRGSAAESTDGPRNASQTNALPNAVSSTWHYLALPGGLLYFVDGQLHISTRHYLRGDDLEQVASQLEEQLRTEEEALKVVRESLHRMEQELMRRLWQIERGEAAR